MPPPFVGSPAHKELMCRFFLETHLPFKPTDFNFPDLDEAARKSLAALPIWDEAVNTEAATALAVATMGQGEKDPLMSEAISLQGYEEGRHSELLALMTKRYAIPVDYRTPLPPKDPDWEFMRIGYGECFDSFFAFGLFALSKDSGFFPPALVELFEPVMQEEARHIIFHANWVAYNQARLAYARRPAYVFRRGLALWLQSLRRVKTALRVKAATDDDQDNFTMKAHAAFSDITPREFIELCLSENERRLKPYDERLLRPAFVPAVARIVLSGMPRKSGSAELVAS